MGKTLIVSNNQNIRKGLKMNEWSFQINKEYQEKKLKFTVTFKDGVLVITELAIKEPHLETFQVINETKSEKYSQTLNNEEKIKLKEEIIVGYVGTELLDRILTEAWLELFPNKVAIG